MNVTANSSILNITGTNNFLSPGSQNGNQTLTINVSSGATLTENLPIEDYDGSHVYSITKSGLGSAVFAGSSNYSGLTTINAGTLQIGNGSSGASIAGTSGVVDNGSLVFNHGDTIGFSPNISGSGSLTQSDSWHVNRKRKQFLRRRHQHRQRRAATGQYRGLRHWRSGGQRRHARSGRLQRDRPQLQRGDGCRVTDSSAAGATPLTVIQSTNTTFGGSFQTGPSGRLVSLHQQGSGNLTLSGSNTLGSNVQGSR